MFPIFLFFLFLVFPFFRVCVVCVSARQGHEEKATAPRRRAVECAPPHPSENYTNYTTRAPSHTSSLDSHSMLYGKRSIYTTLFTSSANVKAIV